MTVGQQLTSANIDALITNYAIGARDLAAGIASLFANVNSQGTGTAVLEAAGYTPGDAATAAAAISTLNTISGLIQGTATQANAFSFNNDLAPYWGGR
jgi:hypothetical protein